MTATSEPRVSANKSRFSVPQLELMKAWSEYLVDSVQRAVLFWDVMRKRGNIFLENVAKGEPPVLIFGYDVLIDGRKLDRPCNYALMQIRPPEGLAIDPTKRPVVVVDPRAGQGPGVGGFKHDSEIGFAFRAGHPVYFIGFYPEPVPGQTLVDIGAAEARFLEEVIRRHPGAGNKPFVIGNCQAGWAVAALAAVRPELTGPIVLVGAPLSYWAGTDSQNPMRYNGGLFGGTWPANLLADLEGGILDGAWLVQNFEHLSPASTFWKKPYDLYARVDTDAQKFLDFERWWGGYYLLNEDEICWIVNELFVGNRLARGEIKAAPGTYLDLKDVRSPVVIFSSAGDNITPPQQALNWIADVYSSTEEIKANGQVIVGLFHETIGHLGIFVSGKVAKKEYSQIVEVLKSVEQLRPGLYLMRIEEAKETDGRPSYTVEFEAKRLEDLRRINKLERRDERPFAVVSAVSGLGEGAYMMLVRPWLRAWRNEPAAWLGRVFHPERVQHWALSDVNPLMWPLAPLAGAVKAGRQPVAAANPFLDVERAVSTGISATWDLIRDARDAAVESLFYLMYGGLLSLDIPSPAGPEVEAKSADPRELLAVQEALEAIDRGGFVEAVARVGALMASQRGEFPLQHLELAGELIRSDSVLSKLTALDCRRVRAEQATVVALEPERALETLPALVAGHGDRQRLFDLIERAVALVDLNAKQVAMLERIRRVLTGAGESSRGNGWARSGRNLQSSTSPS